MNEMSLRQLHNNVACYKEDILDLVLSVDAYHVNKEERIYYMSEIDELLDNIIDDIEKFTNYVATKDLAHCYYIVYDTSERAKNLLSKIFE